MRLFLVAMLLNLLVFSARAESVEPILHRISQAKAETVSYPSSRLGHARQRALDKLAALDKTLRASGSLEGWSEFLDWSSLKQEMAKALPDSAALNSFLDRLFEDTNGLEHNSFIELRAALADLLMANYFTHEVEDFQAQYVQCLETLEKGVAALVKEGDPDLRREIQEAISWLENSQTAGKIPAMIRLHFSKPNFRVTIGHSFVEQFLPKANTFNNTQNVSANILGTSTNSRVQTTATATPSLVPNSGEVQIGIQLKGDSVGNSVGTNGPATVYSRSRTNYAASKNLYFTPLGLDNTEPVRVRAATSTVLDDIQTTGGIFPGLRNRIAWRRAYGQKSAAEAEASRVAEGRFASQVDDQIKEILSNQGSTYALKFLNPSIRKGILPRDLTFAAITEGVQMTGTVGKYREMGADVSIPPVSGKHAIELVIHESLFGNMSTRLLNIDGGMIPETKFSQAFSFLTGRVPRPLRVYTGSPHWAIGVDNYPLQARVKDGLVELTVRMTGLQRENGGFTAPVRATAHYKIEPTRFGPQFVRQGEVVLQAAPGTITEEDRAFLLEKLQAVLGESVRFNGLIAPPGGAYETLSRMRITRADCSQGFITLGYDLAEK